jgi:hypothetical protein
MDKPTLHTFSATCKANEPVILCCLRAIADFSQKQGDSQIAWGSKDQATSERDDQITLQFSKESIRNSFLSLAARILPKGSFIIISLKSDDPATRLT